MTAERHDRKDDGRDEAPAGAGEKQQQQCTLSKDASPSSSDEDEWEDLAHDDDDDDDSKCLYEEDEEDDEDDDDLTWWQELQQAWKQHAVAILVAILATAAAHTYQQQLQQQQQHDFTAPSANAPSPTPYTTTTTTGGGGTGSSAPSRRFSIDSSSSSTTRSSFLDQRHSFAHQHLQHYQRTANITFCGSILDLEQQNLPEHSLLAVMDFYVPTHLIPAMRLHYQADMLADDDYATTLASAAGLAAAEPKVSAHLQGHGQVECMKQQREQQPAQGQTRPKSFVQGFTYYSKQPTVSSMYANNPQQHPANAAASSLSSASSQERTLQAAHLSFTGFAAKFYNLSPQPVHLWWDGQGGHRHSRRLVGEIPPFEALGTATTPGQSFHVSPLHDADHALERWIVTADDAVLYHDPLGEHSDKSRQLLLSVEEEALYQQNKLNQEFAKHYLIHAGRTWLSHFPRAFSLHPMWPALYFGQVHTVPRVAAAATESAATADETTGSNNAVFELRVESVSPKVFSIANFLTPDECEAIVAMARAKGLHDSTVYSGGSDNQKAHPHDKATRSSQNTWLDRDTTTLTEQIYQRAATVLQMDEALFAKPVDHDVPAAHHSIAEALQVIHYKTDEQYTAHHDFVYPSIRHRYQPTRFATLLVYLNDDFAGGATVFPRAVTTDQHDGIRITPVRGTAVLFYSCLEDGNVDDTSQHASEPVQEGEKWAMNLWTWDPVIN